MLGLEEALGWGLDPFCSHASSRMLGCLLLLPVVWGRSLQEGAEFDVNVSEMVTVQQNLCVQVPCAFSYLGKDKTNNQIFFFWYLGEKKNRKIVATNKRHGNISARFRNRFSVIGLPQNHNCTLSIKNAQKLDTGNYTFSIEKGKLKREFENKVFVKVLDLTKKPEIQVSKRLKAGQRGTLICMMPGACEGENSPTFLWMGSALSSQSLDTRTHATSVISFTPKPQDHGTNITCQVTFKSSCITSESTINLQVSYTPEKPTIQVYQGNWTDKKPPGSASHLPVLEGESLHLNCTANSIPAVSLNWMKGNQPLTSSQISAVSLQLHQVGPSDSGEYICQIQEPVNSSKKASLVLSVQYPPKLLGHSCSWTQEGLLCTCSVQAQPAPSLHWWLGDNPVQGNSSNDTFQVVSTTSGVWTNSSLSWRQKPSPALSLRCEGKNKHGTHSASILLLPERTIPPTEMNKKMLILEAACGVAVAGLLALGLLIIVVKTLKRKSAEVRTKASGTEANVCHRDLPSETIPLTTDGMLRLKSSLRPTPLDTAWPTSEEGPELHYACLSFQKLKPLNPQKSTYTGTEYAEIKFQKSPL